MVDSRRLSGFYDRKGHPVLKYDWEEGKGFVALTRKESARLADRPKPDHCECCGESCKTGRALNFDHCHKTGRFRGWLCHGCNIALGCCENNPKRLKALADYQEKFLMTIPLHVDFSRTLTRKKKDQLKKQIAAKFAPDEVKPEPLPEEYRKYLTAC